MGSGEERTQNDKGGTLKQARAAKREKARQGGLQRTRWAAGQDRDDGCSARL